jgi:hypothetical protein
MTSQTDLDSDAEVQGCVPDENPNKNANWLTSFTEDLVEDATDPLVAEAIAKLAKSRFH